MVLFCTELHFYSECPHTLFSRLHIHFSRTHTTYRFYLWYISTETPTYTNPKIPWYMLNIHCYGIDLYNGCILHKRLHTQHSTGEASIKKIDCSFNELCQSCLILCGWSMCKAWQWESVEIGCFLLGWEFCWATVYWDEFEPVLLVNWWEY